jgi:hypothetical protein
MPNMNGQKISPKTSNTANNPKTKRNAKTSIFHPLENDLMMVV